ncbi:MAG: hypothetical protein PWQ97_877 [Tepidanaerobacteraceae bacterium]|nr:hypothetical protein [Tepidanaerobacteraceae bacterium]
MKLGCREFFNSVAEKWDDMCCHDTEKINRILDMAQLKKGDKVLDVGTGTGVMIPFLQERVGEQGYITAIDLAENMLKIAERKYRTLNVSFIHADITTADLDGNFDLILCYSVFPHFKDRLKAIKNMYRLLKPGGRILICHSQSRKQINQIHMNSPSREINRDHLPPASVVGEYLKEQGMKLLAEVDSEEMYVVMAQKMHNGNKR